MVFYMRFHVVAEEEAGGPRNCSVLIRALSNDRQMFLSSLGLLV